MLSVHPPSPACTQLGELKNHLKSVGRGLGANKTLTVLDLSSNALYPDGIRSVCNALRTCLSLKTLDLSYNSPGREAALPDLLRVHKTLQSIGVVEKEPQTRSEKTWWLDNRGKESIGRALLASPGSIMYCQCDAFSLTPTTETLTWTSKLKEDAVVLAGVLRSNTVLKTLNVHPNADLDDFCREEIGLALIGNSNGCTGYSDIYGLKDGGDTHHSVDLKDKDQIRSRRSFILFCGLLRSNVTLTSVTMISLAAEHLEFLSPALATNKVLQTIRLEAPNKYNPQDIFVATLPVQELNGSHGIDTIDLTMAGGANRDGSQPIHRWATAVIGDVLNTNTSIQRLKLNPGGGTDGGAILTNIHRARKSSLRILDLTGIGLSDRGGSMFFETLLEGKCKFLSALHLGDNQLTDQAVGGLLVEVLRDPTCNISTLELNDNFIGAPVITQSLKFNQSLTALSITGNPIDDDGLWMLGEVCTPVLSAHRPPCFARTVQAYVGDHIPSLLGRRRFFSKRSANVVSMHSLARALRSDRALRNCRSIAKC